MISTTAETELSVGSAGMGETAVLRHSAVTFLDGEAGLSTSSRRSSPGSGASRRPRVVTREKVLRRLNGFVVELGDTLFRVAFVQDGETVLYDLPAPDLKKAQITAIHQPFEMDEVLLDIPGYSGTTAYRFRPLATPEDAFVETLSIDADRLRKRKLILEELGHTPR